MFRRGEDERADDGLIHPAEARRREEPGGEVTVVGRGAKIDGTLVSAGNLRVDGRVKGKIEAEGDVSLSPEGQVQADIHARNVVVAGRFKGNIVVEGRAELARGGRVDGNITSKTLVVAEGAVFSGQSIMDGEGEAAKGTQPAAVAAVPKVGREARATSPGRAEPTSAR